MGRLYSELFLWKITHSTQVCISLKPLFSRHNGIGVQFTDEPTGNLDSASSREIMEILKGMHRSGETLILITHDNGIAAQARRVVRIMDGKIESDTINEEFVEEA